MDSGKEDSIRALVAEKVEALRPRLLDLTARNPLIRTNLRPRSNSHMRIVDELPDVLLFNLANGQSMRFVPLPALEEELPDEGSAEFLDALAAARQTDDTYREACERLDPNSSDYLEKSRHAERALKDRLREVFDLPPRQAGRDVNLVQHARNHGITPSYELPEPAHEHKDGRHSDEDIQTLQLSRDLERRLNAIISKGRTWLQETGINVIQAAFGFLEWSDPNGRDNNFSPLIILPVTIRSQKSSNGFQFYVSGTGEPAEVNGVLAERLRNDLGLSLPDYDGGSVEEFLTQVAEISPQIKVWRACRQVVFGVFPSARLAMYRDLDTSETDFSENAIVHSILAGVDPTDIAPFADDYAIDSPEILPRLPLTIADADSSQLSALVDVSDGRNIAVEGPPGTGKSQTIVNAIAGALSQGKKVLFVAEKLAALDVVKSRLEALGLGEFVLPLQAGRSTREGVIQSIRERLELRSLRSPRDYESTLARLSKTREELARYIDILQSTAAGTDQTVHEVLGKGISTAPHLAELPAEVRDARDMPKLDYTRDTVEDVRIAAVEFDEALAASRACEPYWQGTRLTSIAPFQVDALLTLALRAADATTRLIEAQKDVSALGIEPHAQPSEIRLLREALSRFNEQTAIVQPELFNRENITGVSSFLDACRDCRALRSNLEEVLAEPDREDNEAPLSRISEICGELNLESLDLAHIEQDITADSGKAEALEEILGRIDGFIRHVSEASDWTLRKFNRARDLVSGYDTRVLALRKENLSDPAVVDVVRRLIAKGRSLHSRRETLLVHLRRDTQASITQLREAATALKGAGKLSFFSSAVKKARRLYLQLSKHDNFDRNTAVAELESLADYMSQEAKFCEDPHAVSIFGMHFEGADTDFAVFERLLAFVEHVDAEFAGLENQRIRNFLKTAPQDTVVALPDVSAFADDMNRNEISALRDEVSQRVCLLKETLSELESLTGVLKNHSAVNPASIVDAIDDLQKFEQLKEQISSEETVKAVLAERFDGWRTDTELLEPAVAFCSDLEGHPELLSAVSTLAGSERLSDLEEVLDELFDAEEESERLVKQLGDEGQIELVSPVHDAAASERYIRAAAADRDGLFANVRLAAARAELEDEGFVRVIDRILDEDEDASDFAGKLEALVARHLARGVYEDHGQELTQFSGEKLANLRRRFAEMDREIILLSREKLRAELVRIADPPRGNGVGRKSDYTQTALILNEVEKSKRFIPVRDLTLRAGHALIEFKPCWMMSPQAVAQFTHKDDLDFDLCIIDEASQMPPEDAIGALYRSFQTMIVGDTNQLPPTSFFKKMLDEEDDDDAAETVLEESILEMANGSFRPARRLRWHYRSRHAGLISFSNRMIYDDDLIVFPSPDDTREYLGVSLVSVAGRYKSGLNVDEARAVVDAALKFMRDYPNRSLGIATLNKQQADYIRELFENDALPNTPHAQRYLDAWSVSRDGLETFFIKNLENVQGDERDVIFISTVYGPQQPGGPVMQRFGPINGLAGQRRLNVLFSRAKQQIVTFSSMSASDITADGSSNKGAHMLKSWLEYSATGRLEVGVETTRQPDSDFEQFVIDQVKAMGCEPVPQVGVAGYFIDIGVKHPEWPHGFLLGIECDGATYHSARSARDRDRLRQEVLEGLGWTLHRIWSTDWFNDPNGQANVLREVIAERLEELKASRNSRHAEPKAESTEREGRDHPQHSSSPTIDAAQNNGERSLPTEEKERTQSEAQQVAPDMPAKKPVDRSKEVEVGDTVRVRYLTHDKNVLQVRIVRDRNDPSQGIVNHLSPLAEAILGAREGEEVEVLKGSYLRPAIIDAIVEKGPAAASVH